MTNPGWYGESDRHSLVQKLAAEGIKVNKRSSAGYVPGLDNLVRSYVSFLGEAIDASETAESAVEFDKDDFTGVISSLHLDEERPDLWSLYGGNSRELKNTLNKAPFYILGADNNNAVNAKSPTGKLEKRALLWVFVGNGGKFIHPPLTEDGRVYDDNHYLQPLAVLGSMITLPKPITFYSVGENAPYDIGGLVGVKGGLKK
jgi:hypothetical protein